MGKIRKGVLTGIIGNLAFSTYKDKQVIKKRPEYNGDPTIAQVSQRNKLSVVNEFLKGLKPVISVGYQDTDKLSAYNECVSELLKNAITTTDGVHSIDYTKIRISRGTLPAPEIQSVEFNGDSISISWNKSFRNPKTRKNDEAFVLVKDEMGKYIAFDCIGIRTDGGGSFIISNDVSRPCHIWIFFNNPKMHPFESKKKVSDSVYLGRFD